MSDKACRYCGKTLPVEAPFCPFCGKKIAPGTCLKCGAQQVKGAGFCHKCGTPFAEPAVASSLICSKCGKENLPSSKFCRKCGAPLAAPTSNQPAIKQQQYSEPRLNAAKNKSEKDRVRPSRKPQIIGMSIGVLIFIVILFLFPGKIIPGFNPGKLIPGLPIPVVSVISRVQAIQLASDRIQKDGVMALDGRTSKVNEEPTQWHISFPINIPMIRGGEPHVIIDKASGTVTEIFYTQ